MRLQYAPIYLPISSPISFNACFELCSRVSWCQTGVWNETQKQASEKAGNAKGTVKRWKDHIQAWGMDTSYTKAFNIGGKLNTNGWGGLLSYEKRIRAGQTRFYQLSFSEIKHEKQVKQHGSNPLFPELGKATPYVFGKINNRYVLQLGVGKEQLLLPGVLDGNISVSFRYQAGFSLAMLKPYYLKLIHVEYTPDPVGHLEEEKYSSSNAELFLKHGNILGASKWGKGLMRSTMCRAALWKLLLPFSLLKGRRLSRRFY